jgi:hypothetical protein
MFVGSNLVNFVTCVAAIMLIHPGTALLQHALLLLLLLLCCRPGPGWLVWQACA